MELVVDNTTITKETAETVAATWADRARALKIVDGDAYRRAGEMLTGIKALRKQVSETFDPIVEAAHKTHKEACAQRNKADKPLSEAEGILKDAIVAYDDEQERIAAERAALVAAATQTRADMVTIETAAALESAGLHAEAAAALESGLAAPAPVFVPKGTPDVAGVSVHEKWSGSIVDVVAFLKTAIEKPELLELIDVKQSKLDALARTFKARLGDVYPGLRGVNGKHVNAKAASEEARQ